MKRRFTILTAALALLAFLAVPMGMWGQTRTVHTSVIDFETGEDQSDWTITRFSSITPSGSVSAYHGQKIGSTNGQSTDMVTTKNAITSPQSLTCYYTKLSTNTNSNSKFLIQVSSDGSTWTTVATGNTMNNVTQGTWYELTADLSSYSNVFVQVKYDGTSANRGLDYITLIYDDGTTPSTDPEITFTPASITLANVMVGDQASTTFSVAQANLTSDITLSVDNGSLSTSSIAQDAAATTVTWTYTPTTADAISATVTATSGTTTATLAISGTAIAPVEGYDVDFEYDTDMYPNWTFNNMTTYQTGSITAHGGTYYGTTGGKATASITTTSTVANPGTLTCYVSKQSGNTSSSTWYIQVSENGSTWTDVESHSATSMSQGSWVEFTADLTDYTDVYVRVYYSGSTAIRNIDDLTLTTVEPSPAVATTTTINVPQNFNTDIYQGTTAGMLTATVSAEGTPISGATVTWSSSNTGVATIDANGEVTLVAVGTTTITANYTGVEDEYRPSTGTYELTVTDSNAPGTENNPYTVAQARAAIDAGSGTQGVYATGIVSAIPTVWSTQYNNITFNFVDNSGDTDFLQAYRCVSGTGVDASTVAVGDIVVVHGNLIKYSSTYEFGQGCELVSLTHPVVVDPIVTVTPNSINAPFAGAEGTLDLTYENIENFISFDYYFCDANGNELEGDDPDWIYAEINEENDAYTLSYIIDANDGAARTAYMKVYTFDDNLEEVYAIVTVSQAQYVVDYAELPFEWEGGASADLLALNGVTAHSLGSDYASGNAPYLIKFDGNGDYIQVKCDQQPGKVTIGVKMIGGANTSTITIQGSADSETFTDVEELTISGAQNDVLTLETTNAFAANVRYVRMLFTKGSNVGVGPITIAVVSNEASITVNPDEVNVDAEEHDGTLDLTYENLTITEMSDFDIQFCDANGDELSEEPDWIEVLVAEQDPEIGEGYVVSYYMVENEGTDARTAYFKVYAMDEETNLVYSNLVTISQAAPVAPVTGDKYVKVTSTDDLTSGQYLIVYEEDPLAFDGSLDDLDVASNTIEVTINDSEIGIDNITIASEFTIDVTAGTIMSASGYYIGQTSNANGMQTSLETAYTNTISIDENGNANIVSSGDAYLRYNSASNQNRFRYYKSSSYTAQKAIQLYKKVGDEPATETYTLENITGYTGEKDHYFLIASPVTVDPSTVTGMTEGDFDLYYFDESQDREWRNYEATPFNLVPGKGYLYAKKATTENQTYSFELTGIPYNNQPITLSKSKSGDFPGLNLVGNPFGEDAYIQGDRPFYTMNTAGTELEVPEPNSSIERMEGIFVWAESDGETMTFTTTAPSKSGESLVLDLSCGRGASIDRAIVRFDENHTLPKFQLFGNSTKLYIAQDGKDYAVVSTEGQGEMPVNFKAAENGTYTLSVATKNIDMNYLHLIDNMTGMDIDLLQTPSYSFEGRTTDYENRFKLVFANGNADDDSFAFYSDGNWIISNEGNATLQVIDITGHVLSSESINGSTSVNLDAAAGVYMLRLINGDNVKVQKVVVR